MIYILMGVSGCGKTTVGKILAHRLDLPFYDADDFHPEASVAKMRTGNPLTDADREGWLQELSNYLPVWESQGGAVLACSALKEKYRQILQTLPPAKISWIHLSGDPNLISERLKNRQHQFMPATLLPTQLAALEKPAFALEINVKATPEEIVEQILTTMNKQASEFGLIGLGVMGKSLALNLAEKQIRVAIYNRHVPGKEEGIAQKIIAENPEISTLTGFDDLEAFVNSLEKPRKIFLMIMAGAPVDSQLADLIPLLQPGDIIMDGGNSHYKDTARRAYELEANGIHFIGVGVSGGEKGARTGRAIMPGGSETGYAQVKKYFDLIAAKDKNGQACNAYIGPEGAGHFVKMVHNGLEYAEMQLLAETYAYLRFYLQLTPAEMVEVLTQWQASELNSFLLNITIDILQIKEGENLLLDNVLDQAEQKGTGGWSTISALEYGAPFSLISEAVMTRLLSAQKARRVELNKSYESTLGKFSGNKTEALNQLRNAYQTARILNHEMGFSMMQKVSDVEQWNLNSSELARIWTNGCIIRSGLMEELVEILKTEKDLLLAPELKEKLQNGQSVLAVTVANGLKNGVALPVLSAALNYFLGIITGQSPANLIQAQRDYFGAHTFKRIDSEPGQFFHANWKPEV